MKNKQYLKYEDICNRYGISIWTAYRWVSKKIIPHFKVRGVVCFDPNELETWEQKDMVTAKLI